MEALTQDLFEASDKDVIFKLSDGEETAHKAVLAASSDVFKTMLSHDTREKEGTIELQCVFFSGCSTPVAFVQKIGRVRYASKSWRGD